MPAAHPPPVRSHAPSLPLKPPRRKLGSANGAEESRRYAGLSALERRRGRRERLIEAGLEYYGTVGFRHTTIPQLCSFAGVTARHFYEEFETQENLLQAIYDGIAETVMTNVGAELAVPARRWNDIVDKACFAYFALITKDKRRARVFALEVVGVSPALDLHRKKFRDSFAALTTSSTKRFVAQGHRPDIDVHMLSISLAGAAEAQTIDWLLTRPRPSVAGLAEHLAMLWKRSLLMDEATGKAIA